MKNFGKFLCFMLACLLFLMTPVFAAEYTSCADELKQLGLFLGTDDGYALDESLTREQAATMIVRLLGEEHNLASQTYRETFIDVPQGRWSFPYVMYCYENDITKETSANTFSLEETISATEYITFVLRLLGFTDTVPETAFEIAVTRGLINSETVRHLQSESMFLRDDMVYITYRCLQTKTSNGTVFAQVLADKGVLTQTQAESFDVYQSGESMDDILDQLLG